MKVLFLADNAPVVEMYKPIIEKLPCKSVVVKTSLEAVERGKPDVVVMAREETTLVEHKIVSSGIPTLLVPHGMLWGDHRKLWGSNKLVRRWRLAVQAYRKLLRGESLWRLLKVGFFRLRNDFKEGNILSRYDGFTKIAAYGEAMRKVLLGYKVKPENIVITGNPKFDKYGELARKNGGYVLLVTEYLVEFGLWSAKQRKKYVDDVAIAASSCGLGLVVKIHPVLEDKRDYETLASEWGFRLCKDEGLLELVSECNMTVTLMSSVGLEVMVIGKPLIIYNPYNNPTAYTYGVLSARTLSELVSAVEEATNGWNRRLANGARRFVYEQTYLHDGKSADRIAELIMGMGVGKL